MEYLYFLILIKATQRGTTDKRIKVFPLASLKRDPDSSDSIGTWGGVIGLIVIFILFLRFFCWKLFGIEKN
jgi:hypothetical protein